MGEKGKGTLALTLWSPDCNEHGGERDCFHMWALPHRRSKSRSEQWDVRAEGFFVFIFRVIERSEQWSVGEMAWTRSELNSVYWKHLSPAGAASPPSVCIQHFRNSFFPMGEITPTISLYLLWKDQSKPNAIFKIHNIREDPRQFGRGPMNE